MHGDQVWKHIHAPIFSNISKHVRNRARDIFDKIAKMEVKNLFERLKDRDPYQREIDEVSLEMLGLDGWKNRLDEFYSAITSEFEAMLEILERSRKLSKRKGKGKMERESQAAILRYLCVKITDLREMRIPAVFRMHSNRVEINLIFLVRPPGFEPGLSAREADVLTRLDYGR